MQSSLNNMGEREMTTLDEADTNQADKMPPAAEIKAAAEGLVDLIKLRTFPF